MARKSNKRKSPEIPYYGQPFPNSPSPTKGMTLSDLKKLGLDNSNQFRGFMESGLGGSTPGNSINSLPAGSSLDQLLNSSSYWSQIIGKLMQSNSGNNTAIMQMLMELAAKNGNPIGTYDDEVQQQIFKLLLDYVTKNEQREFDKSALDEQRQYDSPTNQLARLMSAGVSRDAAIQLLGQGGESPLVGSGADVGSGTEFSNPTQNLMNGIHQGLSILQSVGGLVSLGFSIPQAIQQTHYLKNSNMLTDRQMKAYDAASRAFGILNNAGAAAESFGSTASAIAAISKLATDGNTDAKDFIAAGGIKQLQDSAPFSSSTLAQLYQSERQSKDYAKRFRNEMRSEKLRQDLMSADVQKTYQEITNDLAELRRTNAEVEKIYQDIQKGDIEINILGETFTIAAHQAHQASFNDDVLSRLEDMRTSLQSGGASFGAADFMAFSQFAGLWEQFEMKSVNYHERDAFKEYVKNNSDALRSIALINALVQNNVVQNLDPDNSNPSVGSSIFRFYMMLRNAGVIDDANNTLRTVSNFIPNS